MEYYVVSDGGDGPVSTALDATDDAAAAAATYDGGYYDAAEDAIGDRLGLRLGGLSESAWVHVLKAAGAECVGPHDDQDPPTLAGGRQVWRVSDSVATLGGGDAAAVRRRGLAHAGVCQVCGRGGPCGCAARLVDRIISGEFEVGCRVGCDRPDQWMPPEALAGCDAARAIGDDEGAEAIADACADMAPADPPGAPAECWDATASVGYPLGHQWWGDRCSQCGWRAGDGDD